MQTVRFAIRPPASLRNRDPEGTLSAGRESGLRYWSWPGLHVAFGGEIIYARAEFIDDGRAEGPRVVEHAALQAGKYCSQCCCRAAAGVLMVGWVMYC